MPSPTVISTKQFVHLLLFLLILGSGFLLRIDSIYMWESAPDHFFLDEEPLLGGFDGYYYLGLAQDIADGTYDKIDEKRAAPEPPNRPVPPPLLSILIAFVSSLTGLSLNKVAIFVPPVLGILIAFPLYAFGKHWGGQIMALTAVALALMGQLYASRTALGALDTDCLNATLALSCAYCFMRFALDTTYRRYIFFSSGIFCYLVFLLWWDQTPTAVTVLSLTPLALALIFYYRPPARQAIPFWAALVLTSLALLFYLGWDTPLRIFQYLQGSIAYITKQETGLFPNIGLSIPEQYNLNLAPLITNTTLNTPAFLLSCVGILWLAITKRKETIFLAPVFTVGLFTFFFAMRFAIFLTPILALGLGYFFFMVYQKIPWKKTTLIGITLFITYLMGISINLGTTRTSPFSAQIIRGMASLQTLTPKNAIIWSWWDEGHPLVYWARRATINDGMVHSGPRTAYTALPLGSDNVQFAANFINFYAVQGIKGINSFIKANGQDYSSGIQLIQDILAAGPEKAKAILENQAPILTTEETNHWLHFFFPIPTRPVFLFLDQRTIAVEGWIYFFAKWDTATQSSPSFLPSYTIYNAAINENGSIVAANFSANYLNGTTYLPTVFKNAVPLHKTVITTGNESKKYTYDTPADNELTMLPNINQTTSYEKTNKISGKYILKAQTEQKTISLKDTRIAGMLINQLYNYPNQIPSQYFHLIEADMPYYQIWEVKGDEVKADN